MFLRSYVKGMPFSIKGMQKGSFSVKMVYERVRDMITPWGGAPRIKLTGIPPPLTPGMKRVRQVILTSAIFMITTCKLMREGSVYCCYVLLWKSSGQMMIL